MDHQGNILAEIEMRKKDFPSKQRKLCNFILERHKDIYIMSVAELADRAEVGRATVMRLIDNLGCESFSEFKRRLNTASILSISNTQQGPLFYSLGAEGESGDNVTHYCNEIFSLLKTTVDNIDRDELTHISNLLMSANHVHVLGLRTSRGIAEYFVDQLDLFLSDVDRLGDNESLAYDKVLRMGKGHLVFIITTLPLTKTTVQIAELCYSMCIPIICITDGDNSPILPYATAKLIAQRDKGKKVSIIPTLGIMEVILNELGLRTAPLSERLLKERNRFLLENDIFTY